MARGGVCDALCQAFRKETIDNEDKLRMKWFIKNRERLMKNLEQEDEHVRDKLKKFKKEYELWTSESESKHVEEIPAPLPVKCDEVVNLHFMRPVDPSVLDILYDKKEVSHEARKKYLKERYKTSPEDRYFLMDCTSWTYGWKLKNFQSFTPKTFNRKPLIKTSFYRNNLSSIKNDDRPVRKGLPTSAKNFKEIQDY